MTSKPALSISHLKTVLSYDEKTGLFYWRINVSRSKAGDVAGRIQSWGYRQIQIDGERFVAHRLAWFYVHGEWPTKQVDHINLDKDDNRIENLRLATCSQNKANGYRYVSNTSGFKGVTKKGKRWQSQITAEGKRTYLGSYSNPEDAHAAYVVASNRAFGTFARSE